MNDVIIDFLHSRACDHSGIEAIDALAERYQAQGGQLHLRHSSADCIQLLKKAGNRVEVNILENLSYFVATNV